MAYLPKASQYKPSRRDPFEAIDGSRLYIAEVEADELEKYRAANHPVVIENSMDFEANEDYILPSDKVVDSMMLDDLIGESRGKMNNFLERQKATERVRGALAIRLAGLDK